MMEDYGTKLGIEAQVKRALYLYWTWARGRAQAWIGDYLRIDRFRTSLPSMPVHDLSEEARRGRAASRYDVEVKALIERARNLRLVRGQIVIDGYDKWHKAIVNMGFRNQEEKAGVLQTTSEPEYHNLMLKREDDDLTPVSHVMSRLEDKHLFVFVPYDLVCEQLDWRLAWFFCGPGKARYVLAFDGDALLLKEIYRRCQSSREPSL